MMIEILVSNIVAALIGSGITYFVMRKYHGHILKTIQNRLERVEARCNDYEAGELVKAVAVNGNGNNVGVKNGR